MQCFGITKNDMEVSKNTIPYIRVLGFNDVGKKIISEAKKLNPNLQVVTSVKSFEKNCKNENLLSILQKDILATNIYSLANSSPANLDYTTSCIVI